MHVDVRYFAALRESLGPSESVAIEPGDTVAQLRDRLLALSPQHAQALSRQRAVRVAVNQVLCDETTALEPGAEVAFFPPVTGG